MRSDGDEKLRDAIAGFKEALHAEAGRPDEFWARQRRAIHSKLQPEAFRRRFPWKWMAPCAVGVAAALLAGVFLANRNVVVVPDIAAGNDQDLLVAVERSLHRDIPGVLAPAAPPPHQPDIVVEVTARGR